jgi:hypothetical protein
MSWAEFAHPKHAHAVSQRDPDFAPLLHRLRPIPRRGTPHGPSFSTARRKRTLRSEIVNVSVR